VGTGTLVPRDLLTRRHGNEATSKASAKVLLLELAEAAALLPIVEWVKRYGATRAMRCRAIGIVTPGYIDLTYRPLDPPIYLGICNCWGAGPRQSHTSRAGSWVAHRNG
jgi:hypothetical protein